MHRKRRQLLKLVGTSGIAALAGCGGSTDAPTETPDSATEPEPSGPEPEPAVMIQQAKLTAGDGELNDKFGADVAFSADGSTALIGARRDDVGEEGTAGAAYVFAESDGSWSQQTRLTASDAEAIDHFGNAVALSNDGTTAVIGAPNDSPNGIRSGSAYVFADADEGWRQQAKLVPADGDSEDEFGLLLALSGDGTTAVVTAFNDEDPNGSDSGSVYAFSGTGGSWRQTAKLTPTDGDENDYFGAGVDLSGDGRTAVIGAWGNDEPNGTSSGSAYVFSAAGGAWTQQAKLAPDNGEEHASFGESVAIADDGGTAIISESDQSVYAFSVSEGAWNQQAELTPEEHSLGFGTSLALSGDGTRAVIGAIYDENRNGDSAGSAHVFSQSDGSWQQEGELVAEDGAADDEFGSAVGISSDGDRALVGAWVDGTAAGERTGSAYVFE